MLIIAVPQAHIERMNRASLGLGIVLSGLLVAWVARAVSGAGDSKIPAMLTFCIGLAFLGSWSNLSKGRLYGNWRTMIPVLFLAPVCALSLFAAGTPDTVWAELLVVLSILFAIHTRPLHSFGPLPTSLVIVGSVGMVVTLVYAWAGMDSLFAGTAEISARLFAGDSKNPNYVSFVAGLVILATSFILWRDQPRLTLPVVFVSSAMILALVVVIVAGTRSTFLGLFACLALALIGHIRHRVHFPRRSIRHLSSREMWGKMFALLIGIAAIVLIPSQLRDYVAGAGGGLLTTLETGFRAYILGEASGEVSAEIRRVLLEQALAHVNVVGHGYKALYVDFPILQAFFDLGLVGGLLFLAVAVLIPSISAFWLIAIRNRPAPVRFAGYVYIFFLPNLFLHGEPYDFLIWLPIVTFYALALRSVPVGFMEH